MSNSKTAKPIKSEVSIKGGIAQYEAKIYNRCDISKAAISGYRHSELNYVSGKKANFQDVDFSYSIMNDCYFHSATFTNCKFIGAKIMRSNFRGAIFEDCDFSYVDITETRIETDQVFANIPDYPNIAREIMQVMRRNANSLGDIRSSRKFVIGELDQRKEHLRRALRAQGDYYKKKYCTFGSRLKLWTEFLWLTLDSFAWGHGEKIWKILIPIILVLLISSGIQTKEWSAINQSATFSDLYQQFLKALEFYLSFFLSVDSISPSPRLIAIEWLLGVLRFLAFGMLISSLFRWLSHR